MANQIPGAVGKTEFEADYFVDGFKRIVVDCTKLTSNVFKAPIGAGMVIVGVRAVVTETVVGATTCKVGDSVTDSGYLPTTDLALTAGTIADSRQKTGAYKGGKGYVGAPNILLVTFDTKPTDGTIELDVFERGYTPLARNEVPHRF